MNKSLKLCGAIILGLILMAVLMGALACAPTEEPVARSYSCLVYTEQGCEKFVVASGGELEVQSGGTFDLQSGATVDFSSGVDLDGSTLTFDADADTTMVASSDDVITATINSTTTYMVISIGNFKVGNGSPSTTQDGEDAYVEGGFEVDGTARFDGAVDMNSTLDMSNQTVSNIGAAGTDFGGDGSLTTAQTITITAGGLVVGAGGIDVQSGDITMSNDETLSNASNGTITATVAANGFFDIAAGNLVVGDPSGASLTLNGNDAYVQGSLEADGLARLDGGASVAGDLEISNGLFLPMFDDLTINDGDTITVTTISVYGLDTSGEVTMTLAACSHDGQTVTLIGDDANTININATNLRTTDGNALTLGQYDVIALICQDTEWLHVSKSANQ